MMTLKQWLERVPQLGVKVLAIGGSDPSGGAGIQQDIRTVTVLGGYCSGVPTALTIQDTVGVKEIVHIDPETVRKQLGCILSDIAFSAVKIGMIGSAQNVKAISQALEGLPGDIPVVLDPVLSSKNEKALLEPEGLDLVLNLLLPHVSILTPNIPEAKRLLGLEETSKVNQETLAKKLLGLFEKGHLKKKRAVIVKGGHSESKELVMDVLADDDGVVSFGGPRVNTAHTHGTGCAFSSCLAALLGGGVELRSALKLCREFMELSLVAGEKLGRGIGPVNTLAFHLQQLEKEHILNVLKEACTLLECLPGAGRLAPEIQINLGYAVPFARTRDQVAAFPGRIVRLGDQLRRVADPQFGASSHVANIILTAMRYDASKRSAMDIRLDEKFLEKAEALGYKIASFSRKEEPSSIKEKEGSSLVWGVKQAIENMGGVVPDLIWDDGDVGKEPAIRVLGTDPIDVAKKALNLL